MNFNKQKCITAVILLLVAILSITVIGKYASSPENHQKTIASLDEKKQTVMELTAASTVTSALITLLPGDTATPIAEKMADVSGYLLVVLCAIYLEKYLVTITSTFVSSLPRITSKIGFPAVPAGSPSSLILSAAGFLPIM